MANEFVDISASAEQIAELSALLTPQQVRQAIYQAVQRTTRSGATSINRRVRQELNLKKKYVDRVVDWRIDLVDSLPLGVITIRRRRLPLVAYGGRASRRKGVTVRVGKNRPPLVLRHAFKVTVRTAGEDRLHYGHEGYFTRARHLPTKGSNVGRGRLTRDGRAGRYAIQEHYGPAVLDVYGEDGATQVAREELAKLNELLERNLGSQIDRFLARGRTS